MSKTSKTNLIIKRKVTKNFTKTPNEIRDNNNISDFTFRVYIYLIGQNEKNTYITTTKIAEHYNRSEKTVQRALKELKDNKLIDIKRVGKKDYIYILLEQEHQESEKEDKKTDADAETKQDKKTDADAGTKQDKKTDADAGTKQDKKTDADAGTKQDKKTDADAGTKQDKKTDADAGTKQGKKTDADAEKKEDAKELTEDEKKINRYNELYNEYCKECTSVTKVTKANKSKIIDIMDKYSEEEIIKTFVYFNEFIKANKGKYKKNYKFLITDFDNQNKMKDSYNRVPKNTNRFNNFKQRNYSKEEMDKLEKSFFYGNNDNDIANKEPMDEKERTQMAIFKLFKEKKTNDKNYSYQDFNEKLEKLTADKTYSIKLMNEVNYSSVIINGANDNDYQIILNDIESIREIKSNCKYNNFEQHIFTKIDIEKIESDFYV